MLSFRGLVLKETEPSRVYPLLNYIFFEKGKSEIPERYMLLNADQVKTFNDTTILGGTLDKYYHLLNIYAYRLIHNPISKIKIIGCNDYQSKSEKVNIELSKARALECFQLF